MLAVNVQGLIFAPKYQTNTKVNQMSDGQRFHLIHVGMATSYSAIERAFFLQSFMVVAFSTSLSRSSYSKFFAIYALDQALVSIISEKNASTCRHEYFISKPRSANF